MKNMLVLTIIFSVSFMHIQAENKPSTLVPDPFKHLNANIFAFAKSTLEDNYSGKIPATGDHSQFIHYFPKANSTLIETIGKYLNTQTEKELQKKIRKNRINTGTILLEDFFNTSSYKKLQKKLVKVVHAMTSCSFLTPEESKILRESKVFYPNDNEKHAYKWNYLQEKHKIKTLKGTLHKIIGLKGNKNFANFDSFITTIDINYQCSMREIFESKFYREPQHNITVTFTFSRYKNGFCKTVAFTFYASGGARYTSLQNTNTNNQCNVDTPHKTDVEKPLTSETLDVVYSSGSEVSDSLDSQVSQISDFIIKTKFLQTEGTEPNA